MSLLTTPVLQYLYREAHGHDIEYRAKNFWQNWLIQEFPMSRHFTVNSEVSPDGDSLTRLDLSVGQIRGDYPYEAHPTLMFQELKRKGTGELKKVEEQLRKGAKKYLEKSGQGHVYGMTGWGTKARVWIIERTSNNNYQMSHLYFGIDQEAHRGSYIDANTDWAYYFSCFAADIRGDPHPEMPESIQQALQQMSSAQGGH